MARSDYNIASVDKAFKIIDFMSEKNGQFTVTQIAAEIDSSISSVNRFLQTLVETGYVAKNLVTNKYFLTSKFHFISNRIFSQSPLIKKYTAVANHLSSLYNVSVNINSMYNGKVFLLYKDTRFYSKDADFNIGDAVPAYCSSAGKIMLASFTKAQFDNYFAGLTTTKFQKNTLTREEDIRASIEKSKKTGYAIHDEEYILGLFTISFLLRDNDGVSGAITLITPTSEKKNIYNKQTIEEIMQKITSLQDKI